MNTAVLSVASNLPQAHEKVLECLNRLNQVLTGLRCSAIYHTPALKQANTLYFNAVAQGITPLDLEQLNALLKSHEEACGRNSEARARHEVPIDIDIVMWNGNVVKEKDYQQSFFQIGWQELCQ